MVEVKKSIVDLIIERNTKSKFARNINIALVGESGTGKSWGGLRIGELYYKKKYNRPFPVDNVVFTITEFLKMVRTLDKGSIIIFDDAGLKYDSKRWWDELNQVLGYTLQSYRYKIINVFFTVPVTDFVDKVGRTMLHGQIWFKIEGVGVYQKFKYHQNYKKTFVRNKRSIIFNPPNMDLVNAYEEKKNHFLTFEYAAYYAKAKKRRGKQLTVEEIINIILENPEKFKDPKTKKFNANLIHSYTEIAINRCYAAAKRLNTEAGLIS
jgi:ABC-type dipeptide/oligopeptide/nickel transport system ATPase component